MSSENWGHYLKDAANCDGSCTPPKGYLSGGRGGRGGSGGIVHGDRRSCGSGGTGGTATGGGGSFGSGSAAGGTTGTRCWRSPASVGRIGRGQRSRRAGRARDDGSLLGAATARLSAWLVRTAIARRSGVRVAAVAGARFDAGCGGDCGGPQGVPAARSSPGRPCSRRPRSPRPQPPRAAALSTRSAPTAALPATTAPPPPPMNDASEPGSGTVVSTPSARRRTCRLRRARKSSASTALDREAEHAGDLLVAATLELAHHDRRALVERERRERGQHLVEIRLLVVARRPARAPRSSVTSRGRRAGLAPAHPADVVRDRDQPVVRLLRPLAPLERAVGVEERRLGDVLRVGRVAPVSASAYW